MATTCRLDGDIEGANKLIGAWRGSTDGILVVSYQKGSAPVVHRSYNINGSSLDSDVPLEGPDGEPLVRANKGFGTNDFSFVLRGWRKTGESLPAKADATKDWQVATTAGGLLFGAGAVPASPVAGTITNPSRIPSGTIPALDVIAEFKITLNQFEAWARDLEAYAGDTDPAGQIPTKGRAYLGFGAQALRNLFEFATLSVGGTNTAITNNIRVACARAARAGAIDVASADQFANSLYPSQVPTPTAVAGWWGVDGRQRALNAMVSFGAVISGFRMADRSYLTAAKLGAK